ncbi:lantibiotic dehydratase [Streptomyces sp. NBC_00237]|uniref:lantibiotic dehydratase n=1 Tax=Streptomyces sp. NBC_00237 TaxID=2975687 RepID=UPI0022543115|nr:lantibiotic dehydratase [Streptomyces sp. NBC_00237]MCX5206027.1 lantibiotic dehydratase [Streptomyces sp. NBC_00237]
MKPPALLRRGDVLLLRAAARPLPAPDTIRWPSMDDMEECRAWLASVWADPAFATAVRAASPPFTAAVEAVLSGQNTADKQTRRVTASTARYLLRYTGRPTPFGLFAGVARAHEGPAMGQIRPERRVVVAADALWLDAVRRDLHTRPDALPHLTLQASNLAVRHGTEVRRTLVGGQQARLRLTRPLAAVFDMTIAPVPYAEVAARLADLGGTPQQITRIVTGALENGFLLSNLSAPMTAADPLGRLLDVLEPHTSRLAAETAGILGALQGVHQLLDMHAHTPDTTAADALREVIVERMTAVSGASRTKLNTGLVLDATVQIPAVVLDEATRAADILLRLTRTRQMRPEWAAYQHAFWERYGAGTLVPVQDAIDLAAGAGLPASYPGSVLPEPSSRILARDELLAAKALEAAVSRTTEVVLTDEDVRVLATDADDNAPTPHTELGMRLYAPDTTAVDRGDFTLSVHPAWSGGCFTGRFADLLPDSGLPDLYAALPTLVQGALPAQLSFTPVYPHAQNVARIPAYLRHVISVDEHREPHASVIPLDDLAVMSTGTTLLLVSLSRRQIVEPVVLHSLALEKQAPPLARFLARVARAPATTWTQFDWGPVAANLPCLPRVRYRRAILSPARWRLPASALPAGRFTHDWAQALGAWAKTWSCPPVVHLRQDDRTLRLDLGTPLHQRLLHTHLLRHESVDLTEDLESELGGSGWIGHAHEIVMPLSSTRPPLPHPDLTHAPVVTNRDLPVPGEPAQPWVQAQLTTHPTVMNQILTARLPLLLAELGDPAWWFVRYRSSAQDEHHLRLRIAAPGPDGKPVLAALSAWAKGLQGDKLAAGLLFNAYRPEQGRYGTGKAMAAAEAVFTADSHAVRLALTHLPDSSRRVLCALGMLDLAHGLLGSDEGTRWMAATPAPLPGVPLVTREAVKHARTRARELLTSSGPLAEAIEARRTALLAYRTHLREGHVPRVLESLLHMHHNRLIGLDRDSEAACRYAARQTARTLQHQTDTP